jgi:non-ribosomal peptide synthetase component E (peptide arylation enzyme)
MIGNKASTRRPAGGWRIRWEAERARRAYEAGHWRRETCADALDRLAAEYPGCVLILDGDVRLAAGLLRARAEKLARALKTLPIIFKPSPN